ncbi:MAG: sigma-54-dependent transcriptional regulator [Granulosicoccaceae bacterium]
MSAKTILVVDDEPDIRSTVQEILADEGYEVTTAENAASARESREAAKPDLVLLDIWMPDEDGITVLKHWRDAGELEFPVVMMSGHGTVETAVEATRMGAVDFIEKPLSLQKLLMTVDRSLRNWSQPANQVESKTSERLRPMELVGQSSYMRGLREQVERLAATDAAVMLIGPSGSLKYELAQHIHLGGAAADAPFVVLTSDMLDERTAAAELFGTEYDGQRQAGLLEQANGGTLFLQDFTELPLIAQKLLNTALERGEFQAVGGTQPRALKVRVIASSNDDPLQAVNGGRLLEELFYRLNVVPIQTLALNEHREDVPKLVESLANALADQEGLNYRHFSVAVQNKLRNHDWLGNVLELRNLVKRLLILGADSEVSMEEIDAALVVPAGEDAAGLNDDVMRLPLHLPLREARAEFERAYLARQLAEVGGRMGDLATRIGMERTHLYRKMRSLGIDTRRARE